MFNKQEIIRCLKNMKRIVKMKLQRKYNNTSTQICQSNKLYPDMIVRI